MVIRFYILTLFIFLGCTHLCFSQEKTLIKESDRPEQAGGQMAIKGKLLVDEDFQEYAEYTKQRQPVKNGWQAVVWHANWKRTSKGIQSTWDSGHMPVLALESPLPFGDVVIEVEFRFHKELGKTAGCRISANNPQLNPKGYAASAWANLDMIDRLQGMVIENDEWSQGRPKSLDNKMVTLESDKWYTMRLELVGDKGLASCNGVAVYGSHEKFALQKTMILIGAGLCPHDFRHLRVYEARPNPTWSAPPEAK